VVIGCYGGCSGAGAVHNEDGALVWCASDGSWEFALLLDAHASVESADLVLEVVEGAEPAIASALSQPVDAAFAALQACVLALLRSPDFRARCRSVQGETACLICARKSRFLWWLSVGDCVLYLFHPELAALGQLALNQRSFFEWIGRANSLDLPVPCYTSGTRELRGGENRILMTTDGLLECGSRPFEDPRELYALFTSTEQGGELDHETGVRAALARVREQQGRDSATLIAWSCRVEERGLYPSA
jgi:serine/threonine protein phosphatase PrpC